MGMCGTKERRHERRAPADGERQERERALSMEIDDSEKELKERETELRERQRESLGESRGMREMKIRRRENIHALNSCLISTIFVWGVRYIHPKQECACRLFLFSNGKLQFIPL